jgi:acyl-coenzyme A synthetase/AMP-(fatty) acid ligase
VFVNLTIPDPEDPDEDIHLRGYHRTSDKGVIVANNQLLVIGRAGHVVQVRGHSVDIMVRNIVLLFVLAIGNA